jgi:putative DNA primase/helicase
MQLGKLTARAMLREASTLDDRALREELAGWSFKSEQSARTAAMIKHGATESGIPILHTEMDRDAWLLNCRSGTLDLRTGKLRAHRQSDLITHLVDIEYDPDAKCPTYDTALAKVFADNEPLIRFWDRLCGMALTGDVNEQILPILWGEGENGKSKLVEMLVDLLGPDLAMIAPPGLMVERRREAHPTERAVLFGKRLVVEVETDDGIRLNESLVKHLTGGDMITARHCNEDFWSFKPTHKLWLCTNNKPVIKGTDHAIWRRPKLVPFGVTFTDRDKIPDIGDRYRREYPGILARCVRGCLDWQKNGLGVPDVVKTATAQYREEQDTVGPFLAVCCVEGDSYQEKATVLYLAYCEFMRGFGRGPMTQHAFGRAMGRRGFKRTEDRIISYLGIGLRSKPGSPEARQE